MSEKISSEFRIINPLGMHMRPVSAFVRIANKYASEIFVEKDGECVSGKSIMGILILSAGCDSVIKVTAEGDDAQEAMSELGALIESGFGE